MKPRLPPPFRRHRRYAYAALPVLFLLTFAAIIWNHSLPSTMGFIMIVAPMAMLRLIPIILASLDQGTRKDVLAGLSRGEIPCSICECRMQYRQEKTCPSCGSRLSVRQHRARWGV